MIPKNRAERRRRVREERPSVRLTRTVTVDLNDWAEFHVTGTDNRGRRIKAYRYPASRSTFQHVFMIRVNKGTVWGVRHNGQRVILHRYY